MQTPTGAQSGSGFVLTSDAEKSTIVTANHVIEGGNEVDVIFDSNERERYQAEVMKHDHDKDVAVLQVPIGNRPALHLAEADSIQEGESIVLIGYPEATLDFRRFNGDGLRPSVHGEIASAIRFNGEVIQFDAATFHGCSGAPIVDATTGDVVAIVRGMLGDPRFSSVGLEQGLPGSTYGPSAARIASVVGSDSTPEAAVATSSQVPLRWSPWHRRWSYRIASPRQTREHRHALRIRARFDRRDRAAPQRARPDAWFQVPAIPLVPILSVAGALFLIPTFRWRPGSASSSGC